MLPLFVVLAIALALPSAASADLVLNKGLGHVRLGMTERQVRAHLGRPETVTRSGNHVSLSWRSKRLNVLINCCGHPGRVDDILASGPIARTAAGVGFGSTHAQIKAAFPSVRCSKDGYGCTTTGYKATNFTFSGPRGRVDGVHISWRNVIQNPRF